MPEISKAILVVIGLLFFSASSWGDPGETICAAVIKSYKIAVVGDGYGETEIEKLISGANSFVPCKSQFKIEVVFRNVFESKSDYFRPQTFRNNLLTELSWIASQSNSDFNAVLLNLDLPTLYTAAGEIRNGKVIYENILKSATKILQQATHIKGVLVPAGNHGNFNQRTGKWKPTNLAHQFKIFSFPSKKFMLVASANAQGKLAADTGFLNCGVLRSPFSRSKCQKNFLVKGEATGLPGLPENTHPETYLAASVVMWNLIQVDFNLNQIRRGALFLFNP